MKKILGIFLSLIIITFFFTIKVTAASNNTIKDELLNIIWTGYYEGYYDNNISVKRNVKIRITDIDETGKISGSASFSPFQYANHQAQGSYLFNGNIDFTNLSISFSGYKWISKPNDGYDWKMPKFDGVISSGDLSIRGTIESTSNNNSFYFAASNIYKSSILSPVDIFQYKPNEYNNDLAIICAKYSMLAYELCNYENENYFIIPSKETTPKYLIKELNKDHWKNAIFENYCDENMHNSSFTIASKKVFDLGVEKNIILVVIRGTDRIEWDGNMDLTGQTYDSSLKLHYSFNLGAETVTESLIKYVNKYELKNSILLVTGHSRGAAVANILAKNMTDNSNNMFSEVFAYTFATPNLTLDSKEICSRYDNIFNFCYNDDFVPSVPLSEWGYSKYGNTFTTSAEYSTANVNFKNEVDLFVSRCGDKDGKACFNYKAKNNVIEHLYSYCPTPRDYYEKEFLKKGTIITETVYEYFRNTVAPAARGSLSSGISILWNDVLLENDSEPFKTTGKFFFNGSGRKDNYINDNHQAYTYYSGIKNGCFNLQKSQRKPATNLNDEYEYIEEEKNISKSECNSNDIKILNNIYINSINDNKSLLNWNDDNLLNWEGVSWELINGIYNVSSLNISQCGIKGNLNINDMKYLKVFSCDSNTLNSIVIEDCPNLLFFSCTNNEITSLTLSNVDNLKTLYIYDNFINFENYPELNEMIEIIEKIKDAVVISEPQNVIENGVYSFCQSEVDTLIDFANNNTKILNWSRENLSSLDGIQWKLCNGEYHVNKIDLDNLKVTGTLDLSDFSYLTDFSAANTLISTLYLPESIIHISKNNLYNCNELNKLFINGVNTMFEFGSLYYSNANLCIISHENSNAKYFALENDVTFLSCSVYNCYTESNKFDVNKDNILDVKDVLKMIKYLNGTENLSDQEKANSDVNNDYIINVLDLILLKNKIILKLF